MLVDLCRAEGWRSLAAPNVEEVLRGAKGVGQWLVLWDVDQWPSDGDLQLSRLLSAGAAVLPLLSFPEPTAYRYAKSSGAAAVLVKPLLAEHLFAELRRIAAENCTRQDEGHD